MDGGVQERRCLVICKEREGVHDLTGDWMLIAGSRQPQRQRQRQRSSAIVLGSCLMALAMTSGAVCKAGDLRGRTVIAPQLQVQVGHASNVEAVAVSPDGRYVLTGGWDRTARLWELQTGREIRSLLGHTDAVSSVSISPNGRYVLTGSWSKDCTVRLWDAATGIEVRRFEGHNYGITSSAFSPDGGRILAASADGTIRLWELATGREIKRFEGGRVAVISPDGRYLFAGGDNVVRVWEIETGKELQRLPAPDGAISSVAFSSDGRYAISGGYKTARLWDVATWREIRRFEGHRVDVGSVVFATDGRQVLTVSAGTVHVWELGSGHEIRRLKVGSEGANLLALSPDARYFLTNGYKEARLWETATGREVRHFAGNSQMILAVAYSSDGRYIAVGGTNQMASLWDLSTGREVRRLNMDSVKVDVDAVAISRDNRFVVTAGAKVAELWDLATGQKLRRFQGHLYRLSSVEVSPDGRYVLTGSWDHTARVWETETGREVRRFLEVQPINGLSINRTYGQFSPDGRSVITLSDDTYVRLWDVESGRETLLFNGDAQGVRPLATLADSSRLLVLANDREIQLVETATGRELRRMEGNAYPIEARSSSEVSPNGRYALFKTSEYDVGLWDLESGRRLRGFKGPAGFISSVAFSPDARQFATGGQDQTTRIWNTHTGEELVRLISFTDGTWVVTTPDGRFDTNNLEEIKGLHWIMPDDPMRALPLEIFMRDYYEPRLLPRVLAGEKLPPLPSLAELNRAQPKVEIKEIQVEDVQAGLVAVTVEVASDTLEIVREGNPAVMQSGAYDLRVFRDGQLVAQLPEPAEEASPGEQTREQEISRWRSSHEIKLDPKTGKKTITFHGIRLPRKAGLKEVEFSAYAFNIDRVKSATTPPYKLGIQKAFPPHQARAYVVTIGVNGFEHDAMSRLSYAANDAKGLTTELSNRLKGVQDPETGKLLFGDAHVVPITLVTEFGAGDQAGTLINNQATKDRIKAVIEKLAGKPVDAARLKGIANADQLLPAQPEDLVLIAFSTHGDTDRRGQFYLMPYDLGASAERTDILKRAISSEELSAWLRTLDAGELVMIVDACHSAATVESQEFKPGPMGSRGLGQLAFDKGMRILAASQRDQSAMETERTQQGLLSYALVREGLQDNAADFKPKDMRIQLSEWLSYGVERVPGLYRDYREGKLKARAATPLDEPEGNFVSMQQPALFDFARGRDIPLMVGVGR